MNRYTALASVLLLMMFSINGWAVKRYGEMFCQAPDYTCITIKPNESWESLFPNTEQRDITKRVNRMNVRLQPGMIIAVPKHLDKLSIYDVSPFPRYIDAVGEKIIYVSQKDLAWGAYDEQGELLWWGPLSSGTGKCSAALGGCKTPTGAFRINQKQDIDCISKEFPIRPDGDNGGAEMPFCMHFYRGYALHGSYSVPGYRDSHGCVRMFIEDAQWLNEQFVTIPEESNGMKGTRVVVEEY